MASYVNEVLGEELLIKVDTTGAGAYAVKFIINTDRSVEQTVQTATTLVPRTDDPSQPHKTARVAASTDSKISGAGLVHATDVIFFRQWAASGQPKNIQAGMLNRTGANGGYTLTGSYILTSFVETGKAHEGTTASMTLEQADQPTLAANA